MKYIGFHVDSIPRRSMQSNPTLIRDARVSRIQGRPRKIPLSPLIIFYETPAIWNQPVVNQPRTWFIHMTATRNDFRTHSPMQDTRDMHIRVPPVLQ